MTTNTMTVTNTEPETNELDGYTETPKRDPIRYRESEQTLRFTPLDSAGFNRACESMPVLDETRDTLGKPGRYGKAPLASPLVTQLQFDTFLSLVRRTPKPSGMGSPLVASLVERMTKHPKYQETRQYTVTDEAVASLASVSVLTSTVNALAQDLIDAANAEQKAREKAADACAFADAMKEDGSDPNGTAEAMEAAADARAAANAAGKNLKLSIQGHGRTIQHAINTAMDKAAGDSSAASQACRSFGVGSTDPSGGLSPKDKFALAEQVLKAGPAFKRFTELLGRMTRDALRKQAEKTQHDTGEIVDITLGNELDNAMDEELAGMVNPLLAGFTRVRMAMDELMLHDVNQKETLARGDIVILIDESGSMSGEREAEAKAVALALGHVAIRQGRRLIVHFFQSTVTHTIVIDPADLRASEKGYNLAISKFGEIAGRGTAGGTSFDAPLLEAVNTVRNRGYDKADVLMITDGECDVQKSTVDAINRLRDDTGANVYAMLIGYDGGRGVEVVKQFSNRVWNANTLLGAADELFDLI